MAAKVRMFVLRGGQSDPRRSKYELLNVGNALTPIQSPKSENKDAR